MDDKYNCHYDDNDTSTNNYRGTYHYEPNFEEQKPEPPNTFATASLVLGILSLVLCCCCYVSIPLGGLGIFQKQEKPCRGGRKRASAFPSSVYASPFS